MNFDGLFKNQKKVVKLFQNSLKKDRFVHTYLFEGVKGTSKLEAAYYFAAMMLCDGEKKPCLQCDNCKKVLKGVHPSVFLLTPDNGMIKKEQAEALQKEFSLTALAEGRRIYIIDEIDKANPSAANSLLKILEDLGSENYVIMTTESIDAVISTIRSRAQIISFDRLPAETVAADLIARGFEEETARVFANLSNSAEEVTELLRDEKILPIFELAKKVGISCVHGDVPPLLVMFSEGECLLREPDRRYHQLFLDLLVSLCNDKLYFVTDQMDRISYRATMQVVGEFMTDKHDKVISELETILKFKQRIKYNVNLELMYAQMFVELKNLMKA